MQAATHLKFGTFYRLSSEESQNTPHLVPTTIPTVMNFLLENANARVHAQEPKLTHVSPLSLLELKVAEEDPQGIETYNRK